MCRFALGLLTLVTLSGRSSADEISCPEPQRPFRGSCYEFVDDRLSFAGAQAWCERSGGHLAFIQDEDTQYFLEKHMDPEKDTWIGVASAGSLNSQDSSTAEGALSWLDDSHIAFSNWASRPQPGAACGHILRHSGFQWETSRDCDNTLSFVCQTESRRSIACADGNAALQCRSGQFLMIDDAFYGRQNLYYCRSTTSTPAASVEQCGWVNVLQSLTARCHGRQGCHTADVVKSFEPCPQLGSYLSVEYHCEDAQKTITVLEPVTDVSVRSCYAGTQSFHATNCKALSGAALQIQMEARTGSNVSYRIQSEESVLFGSFVVDGNVSHNITVSPEVVKRLGPGCHQLTIHASNRVTFPEVSTELQVCVLEAVAGLQAWVLTDTEQCLHSSALAVGVSLDHGQPALLLFSLTGDNGSFCDRRKMNARKETFHIDHTVQGTVRVKVSATNIFSSLEVDMFSSCDHDSVVRPNGHNDGWLSSDVGQRVVRSPLTINAQPSASAESRDQNINLSIEGPSLNNPNNRYQWECRNPCRCSGDFVGLTHIIIGRCLPDPFEFYKYHFKVIKKSNNDVKKDEVICISFDPVPDNRISLSCTQGCNHVQLNTHAKIQMSCGSNVQCPQVVWTIEDPRGSQHWPAETKSCYQSSETRPLVRKQHGGTEYTVSYDNLALARSTGQDVTVVVTYAQGNQVFFTKYTMWATNSAATSAATVMATTVGDATVSDLVSASTLSGASSAATAIAATDSTTPLIRARTSSATTIAAPTSTTPLIRARTSAAIAINAVTSSATAATENSVTSITSTIGASTDDTSPPASSNSSESLSCIITPSNGTVLDAFNITCETEIPCSHCHYCFTADGKHLRCTESSHVALLFLPLGDSRSDFNLNITATATNHSFVANTTLTAQVMESAGDASASVSQLESKLGKAVAQLKEQGLLSGETLGQIISSVSDKLSSESDEFEEASRRELRTQMLHILIDAVKEVPINSPEEVQVVARGLAAVSAKDINATVQEEASLFLVNLSSSLVHMDVNKSESSKKEMQTAVSAIVEGVSNILDQCANKSVSDALLVVLKNTQSALLTFKENNKGPTFIQKANVGVFVNRVTPDRLHQGLFTFPNCSCPSFSLPALHFNVFPAEDTVDVRMLSLDKNPFSWHEGGNISGQIVSLSLTTKNGSVIHVENLSEDIEILLPRPVGEHVNSSVLDLGNYSTTVIDIPLADTTLVIKLVPSNDPLPFKLLLGYMSYPTEDNYVAMTEMPQQGSTQEERYTWLVDSKRLQMESGVHYLVVKPIVGPGIKSVNATLSIISISAACQFWNESILQWSSKGCRVGARTSHLVTQCFCNHLTFFGSSFFVTPNLVDASRTAELFGTFAENPVVVCFVGALFVAYLFVVVWARRKDIQDMAKVRVSVLEDNDPMDKYRYLLCVSTGHRRGAFTSSQVTLTLLGAGGNSEPHHLTDPKKCVFERGAVDMFLLTTPFSLGDLQGVRLWHNNSGSHPAWYVGHVMVQDVQTDQKWHFLCNSWLAIDLGDCSLDKVFPVSTETDLKSFSNLFLMKTTRDLSDGHLWYSVISRPPSSTFTRVQRVSCCFSLLLCTMLTSIMFYGIPTDPSEQTMDLGHFEFTWQQFMIGVQSSLIMFPVNILIVSLFRHTRPRETSCCRRQPDKPEACSSQTAPPTSNVTLDTIAKDIAKIVHLLSRTTRSDIPSTGPESGRQEDICALLCVVEDLIRHNYKSGDPAQPQEPDSESGAGARSESHVEAVQRSSRTRCLHTRMCHIDRELSRLGSAGFPSPHSYSQALQKVQDMKVFLEDQLLTSSSASAEKHGQNKLSVAGSTDADSRKHKGCCHGGLPWWFIFVSWLLVVGTSFVAGYYTMLYGLKFGKERSISWLVSMVVSFFQSILITQPLKVLCLAAFFALVIKKVDEEDFQNVAFDSKAGDRQAQRSVRQDSSLYEPPAPGDVERMKRIKIIEQKAFALLREIFIYAGFMWMLLLVAYGQRDPNAFLLNQHIRRSFSPDVSRSMSLGDVFAWANTSLLSNLFGVHPGFITDGNSKLVGNARLRQLRVQKDSCQTASSTVDLVSDCHAPYSWEVEDMGSYGSGWNRSVGGNHTVRASSPWTYQTQAQLRAFPVWGRMVLYRGGGFVATLGPDLKNASRTIEYLFRNTWLDVYTRALFVEFTIYNANVNLFCIVTLLLETTALGAFQFHSELQSVRLYQSTGNLHIFVMAAEILYLLFIIYYMFLQGKLMKRRRWDYFSSKWNLLELAIILLSLSALAVFIRRTLLGGRDITYYQNHKDQFPSFYETASADSALRYLIAFLVLLATVKLWHLLRLNPTMHLITAALQRAWADMSGFLLIIAIMFIAYSVACNVIYGWKISSYKTLADALLTIISLQMGIFNYSEVLDFTPVLGGLLIGSCIVFMTFVVLNLLITVILVAFQQEQLDHKPSEEKEIVDVMLKKIYSFLGIRRKDNKASLEPDVNDSGIIPNISQTSVLPNNKLVM